MCSKIKNPPHLLSVKRFYTPGVQGVITSPNYPRNYGYMKDYYWRLATYRGRVIEITIDFLDIESDPNCAKDFLKVYDGVSINAPLLKTFCGGNPSGAATVRSSRYYAYLHFKADGTNDGKGFRVTWKALKPVTSTASTTNTIKPEGINNFHPHFILFAVFERVASVILLSQEKLDVLILISKTSLLFSPIQDDRGQQYLPPYQFSPFDFPKI